MKKPLQIGLVGSGYFGGQLARALHALEDTTVTAVHGGSRAAALAEELGCALEERLEALMERSDVDAVVVASPNHAHEAPVLLAARHGKHVFCEKPVALSLDDCERMLAACREAGVLFMAGHIMHFMNGVGQAKQWIEDGAIGRPIVCSSERTGWEDQQPSVSWKKNNATSGGHLFHHIHELDLMQAVMGPARSVSMAGGNLAHHGEGYGDEEDVLLLTLEFERGGLGTMQLGSGFRLGEHFVKINGTEGAILIDLKRSTVELRRGGRVEGHLLHDTPEQDEARAAWYRQADRGIAYGRNATEMPDWLTALIRKEMTAFRDAVLGRPIPAPMQALFDGSAARSSIATAEASMRALREQRWVEVAGG
ncbi:Gfo/Idh/MocA family protein [Paenibacillus sp. HJGM_3]|uniref:Gfo/Idh/MocA family protein n=1 Tax=Paenibacillus sp. HJGM_3 TaxID=3379816 RepID=UPI00385E0476